MAEQARRTGPADLIVGRRGDGAIPVSFQQQRLWWLDQLEPGNPAYNVPRALRMTGPLAISALHRALAALLDRHEILRTTFTLGPESEPVQRIASATRLPLPIVELGRVPAAEREARALALAYEESLKPFDLEAGPLMRTCLLRMAQDEHLLLWTLHHIVSDGWSAGVLVQELAALYDAFINDRPSPLAELPIQYADYAAWQRERMRGPLLEQQLAYWRQQLNGAPQVLELPTDRPRPAMQSFQGARETLVIPKPLADAARALARREDATLFMTLLACFKVLLLRYTGQDDLVVGTPIAGRNRAEIESLVGCFTNTLVLRTDLSGDPTFRTLLARVREVALGGYAHQDLPFEKLVEDLQPDRDLSRNPLFQVLFVLQNAPRQDWHLPGLNLRELDLAWRFSKFDLSLYMSDEANGLWTAVEYNTDLFEAGTITRLLGHLQTLLASAVAAPDTRLSQLPLLTPAEQQQLIVTWNATAAPLPADANVPSLIAAQAKRTPNAVAVTDGVRVLTYGTLMSHADALATILRERGVGPDSLVGVALDRTVDLVVALLAVWRAGGAYVPLDAAYPPDRLAFMIGDAGLTLLLTDATTAPSLPATDVPRLVVDGAALRAAGTATAESGPAPGDLAYVIYTSGSTGQPKGVAIPQHALVNALLGFQQRPGIQPSDRLLAVTTLGFDIAGLELWLPLITGARCDLVSRETAADGAALLAAARARGTTVLQATPATWRLLIAAGWTGSPAIRAWCGGEALPPDLAAALTERSSDVWNLYGPTETTIWSTALQLTSAEGPVPIGGPIANTSLYVVDQQGALVPVGIPGELFIGGAGLARGYWRRPELTAERFVPDRFGADPQARLYRTGDRVRRRNDGTLEYLGRFDHQIKLRGFRIELGEIDARLAAHPGVAEAVTIVHGANPDDRRLVAYLVHAPGTAPLATDVLRQWLKTTLPDYMVPAVFVPLAQMPRTPNGKIDRRALPAPDAAPTRAAEVRVAPRDSLERQLTNIWEQVLEMRPIGITDNFFERGGHSLLAVKLFAMIERTTGHRLPLTALFQAPTIERLAELLRTGGWSERWSSLVPIQAGGSKPPFYCLHAAGGVVLFYRDLARHLGPDQPVYGLQAQGLDGRSQSYDRVEDMAAHYIREVRAFQPKGPYFLGGECFGGRIALEMARQLRAQGEEVGLLALFNTFGPGYPALRPGTSRLQQRLNFYRLRFIDHHLDNLRLLPPSGRLSYVAGKVGERANAWRNPVFIRRRLQAVGHRLLAAPFRGLKAQLPAALAETQNVLLDANRNYVPQPYAGKITLFRASKQPPGVQPDPTLGWSSVALGELEIHEIPGSAIVLEPRVRALAERLSLCLARAQGERAAAAPPDQTVEPVAARAS